MNYLIVVFKNKRKKKIINKFSTSKGANDFYKKLISLNSEVDFEIQTQNGKPCVYEVALLEKKSSKLFPIYTKDEFGRNVKLDFEDEDYDITKISTFKEPEKILDYQTKQKINFNTFVYKYLTKDGLKLVSKLNNKIIVQNDDTLSLFVLKTDSDAFRFSRGGIGCHCTSFNSLSRSSSWCCGSNTNSKTERRRCFMFSYYYRAQILTL